MNKQQDPLPPLENEPNQAEIDAQQAEIFRKSAAEQNAQKESTQCIHPKIF